MFLRQLLIRKETFDAAIPVLKIGWDRLPNPTQETRQVYQAPCKAHRLIARNILGKLLLKRRWKRGNFGGPAAFRNNGVILEIYPVAIKGETG